MFFKVLLSKSKQIPYQKFLTRSFAKESYLYSYLLQPPTSTTMFKRIWRVMRIIGFILLPLAIFIAAVLIFPKVEAQQKLLAAERTPRRQLDSIFYAQRLADLRRDFGENKELLPGFELQNLLALSYYPELKGVKMQFVYKNTFIPLSSRPDALTMFGKREKWVYRVIVSSKSAESMEPILLKHLPFDAQVGILAHEIGHTAHYQPYNFWQMAKFAILYAVDTDFRAIHERSTDEIVIYHGLGWQLFDYAKFVRTDPTTTEHYQSSKDFIDKFYLTPTDILSVMSRVPIYGNGTAVPAPY